MMMVFAILIVGALALLAAATNNFPRQEMKPARIAVRKERFPQRTRPRRDL